MTLNPLNHTDMKAKILTTVLLTASIIMASCKSDPDGTAVHIYENRSDEVVSVELYNVHDPEKPPVLELEFSIEPGKSYTLTQSGDVATIPPTFDSYNIWLDSYLLIRQGKEEWKQTYEEFEGTLFDLDEYVVIAREELKITYRHILY